MTLNPEDIDEAFYAGSAGVTRLSRWLGLPAQTPRMCVIALKDYYYSRAQDTDGPSKIEEVYQGSSAIEV